MTTSGHTAQRLVSYGVLVLSFTAVMSIMISAESAGTFSKNEMLPSTITIPLDHCGAKGHNNMRPMFDVIYSMYPNYGTITKVTYNTTYWKECYNGCGGWHQVWTFELTKRAR